MSRNSRPHVRDFRDNYATCSDFCEVFRRNTTQLYLLAFLLTANHQEAQECFVGAMDKAFAEKNATAFSAVAFMVAGGGFEPPTFGLCDLTHLSMRVGLYLHPRGLLAIQSLRLPPVAGAWFGIAISLARRRFHRL